MITDIMIIVALICNTILLHVEWKRIENLEKWTMHLLEQNERRADDEADRR